ncbi:MAG: hypothetical protein LUG98_00980 [Tannerellaceae bacterium]|nr:hypothetical protein [Tannerellaceae bacterium]
MEFRCYLPAGRRTVKATASAYNLFDKYTGMFIHYPATGRFLLAGVTVTCK